MGVNYIPKLKQKIVLSATTHKVLPDETIFFIAFQYFGTPSAYRKIVDANLKEFTYIDDVPDLINLPPILRIPLGA